MQKASVVAGSVVSGTWASDLVLTEGGAFADFAEFLRPETILGKLRACGMSRSTPRSEFRPSPVAVTGSAKVAEAADRVQRRQDDACAAEVREHRRADRGAASSGVVQRETLVRDEMQNALVQLIDTAFIDPANAGTANVKPASIANGAPHSAASGTGDADDVRSDLRSLINEFIAANSAGWADRADHARDRCSWCGNDGQCSRAAGIPEHQHGRRFAVPGPVVVTSQTVPSGTVIAVQPSDIFFADDGGFMVDVSREASLQMLDNPTNDTVTTDGNVARVAVADQQRRLPLRAHPELEEAPHDGGCVPDRRRLGRFRERPQLAPG
jgi:hypothetical protein